METSGIRRVPDIRFQFRVGRNIRTRCQFHGAELGEGRRIEPEACIADKRECLLDVQGVGEGSEANYRIGCEWRSGVYVD